jgi:hypothetical protein
MYAPLAEWNLAAATRILGLHRNSLKVRPAVLGSRRPAGSRLEVGRWGGVPGMAIEDAPVLAVEA